MASSSASVESAFANGERRRKKKPAHEAPVLQIPAEAAENQKVYFTVAIIDQRETTRLGS